MQRGLTPRKASVNGGRGGSSASKLSIASATSRASTPRSKLQEPASRLAMPDSFREKRPGSSRNRSPTTPRLLTGMPLEDEANRTAPREPTDAEVVEFLEGLLEGFRIAGIGARPEEQTESGQAASWTEIDELFLPALEPEDTVVLPLSHSPWAEAHDAGYPGAVPKAALRVPEQTDRVQETSSMSTTMRRHALKSFLEETCGTVANAFDVMAGLAIKASLGGSGSPQDRFRFHFEEDAFQKTLMGLGYGVGGQKAWWHSLFLCMDVDGDGAVSLQDMYDALVLSLPFEYGLPEDKPAVFFTEQSQDTWRQATAQRRRTVMSKLT